jgi:hypothetical protein
VGPGLPSADSTSANHGNPDKIHDYLTHKYLPGQSDTLPEFRQKPVPALRDRNLLSDATLIVTVATKVMHEITIPMKEIVDRKSPDVPLMAHDI